MRRLWVLTILAAVVAAGQVLAQEPAPAPRDTVRMLDGKLRANLTVLSETPTEVKIDTNGDGKPDETIDQNTVKSVDYGNPPAAYSQALAYFKVRQYTQAIASFKEAAAAADARPWVKDYTTYYIALCQAKSAEATPADRPKAIQAFEVVLRDANNRWRDDAKYQLGDLYLAAGDRAKALATFESLEKDAYKEDLRLNAASGLAALLMADNKPAEALKRYDTIVAGAKDKFADLYVSALVGKAEALTALKQYGDAEQFLSGVITSSTNEEVLSKARVALGDCYFAQGAASKDETESRSKYKAALNEYLWDVVVFFNQKNECARSLLYAGRCWEKLGDKARADALYKKLRDDFGATKWAGMIGG